MQDLRARHLAAQAAVAALADLRAQIDAAERQLENPNAAREYIDFFAGFFTRAAEEIERIASELGDGAQRAHADTLRQLASNSAAETRRTVMFRDKWINKPLPYETMRPLLTAVSQTTRDQLDALRGLNDLAAALETELATPEANPSTRLDRRQLFTRLFRPAGE